MNPTSLSASFALLDLSVVGLTAQQSAVLIMLAASLLVFRTFRERYLLVWILGWAVYFGFRCSTHNGNLAAPLFKALAQAEFMVAVCVFAATVFLYTHTRKFLTHSLSWVRRSLRIRL